MAERQTISRVGDSDNGSVASGQEEQRHLTLTGIVTKDDHRQRISRAGDKDGGTDNYVDFGGTGVDRRVEAGQNAGGDRNSPKYEGGTKVCVREGETLWGKAEQQYGGKHPLEAIYAANGMYPKVTQQDGKVVMTDPTYKPGEYVLPDPKDIPALTKQYREHVEQDGRSSQQRTGTGEAASDVKLIYGDTFERLSRAKYGHSVPVEAIYAANDLKPRVVDGCEKEPIYYAGKTYHMPAEKDIPGLVRKYYEDQGHPEKCPQQYRQDGGKTTGTDNYGDDGQTPRDKGQPPKGDGQQRDTKYYNEGYEDGYKDGMARGRKCACGGGGCESCRGKQHHHQTTQREAPPAAPVVRNDGRGPVVYDRGPVVYDRGPRYDSNGYDEQGYRQPVYGDRYQRQPQINPLEIIAPLAIAGLAIGLGGRGHNHRYYGGGYDEAFAQRQWQQEQMRRQWQQYNYGGSNYDSEYGYGRRDSRYYGYQGQQQWQGPQYYNPGHHHRWR